MRRPERNTRRVTERGLLGSWKQGMGQGRRVGSCDCTGMFCRAPNALLTPPFRSTVVNRLTVVNGTPAKGFARALLCA